MKRIVFLLIILSFLTSCITQKRYAKICSTCPVLIKQIDTIKEKDSIVVRDTSIKIEQDSSLLSLYLECVNGKVEIKKSEAIQGKRTRQSYNITPTGKLSVPCIVDSAKISFAWNESHKTVEKVSNKEFQRPVPLEMTKMQKFYLTFGKWAFWLIIAGVGIFLILEIRRFVT